jgi:NAD(P)-dependent dehydrogenase (short-subunit alcohol dehydrogenase family)
MSMPSPITDIVPDFWFSARHRQRDHLRLADDGFDVVVNDVSSNAGKLDQLVDEIKARGCASSKHIADVSMDGQVREMVEQVVEQLGAGLDVVRHFINYARLEGDAETFVR